MIRFTDVIAGSAFGVALNFRQEGYDEADTRSVAVGFGTTHREIVVRGLMSPKKCRSSLDRRYGWERRYTDWCWKGCEWREEKITRVGRWLRRHAPDYRQGVARLIFFPQSISVAIWWPKRGGVKEDTLVIWDPFVPILNSGNEDIAIGPLHHSSESYDLETWTTGKMETWTTGSGDNERYHDPEILHRADGMQQKIVRYPKGELISYYIGDGCDDQGTFDRLKTSCFGGLWVSRYKSHWWLDT